MALLRPTVWTSQPQVSVGIDWSNPIARGLTSAWVNDIESTQAGTKITPYGSRAIGKFGVAGKGNGSSTFATLRSGSITGSGFNNSSGPGITRLAVIKVGAANASRIISSSDGGAGQFGLNLRLSTTSVSLSTAYNGAFVSFTNAVVAGEYCVIAVLGKTGQQKFFKNGGFVGSASAVYTYVVDGDSTIGQGNGTQHFDGEIFAHLSFDRMLSDAEAATLTANPWQIFKPIPRRLFVPVSSGGANTWNLDPTSASHGQTSGAGALVLSYLLSAASASHAQSATQAEITTGKTFDPVATNHAQSATSPAITFNVAYAPSGASHAQSVTQSAIALAYTLSPSGALHAQSATVSEISSGNVFDPVSSSHAHSAASPAISLNITATPASASHAHSSGPSALNLRYVLSVNGADHAQIAGQCSLTIGGAGTGATAEEIAAAVWAHVTRTLTASAGPSAESIAAATVSALMATMIPVDVQKMNSAEVIGDGSEAEPWRGLGVPV